MTPEEARELLDGTTPGPWEPHPDYPTVLVNLDQKMAVAAIPGKPEDSTPEDEANLTMIAATPDMAKTIAGMTTEYRVVALDKNGSRDFDLPAIYQTGEESEARINHLIDDLKGCFRIEKRTVTEWEVTE